MAGGPQLEHAGSSRFVDSCLPCDFITSCLCLLLICQFSAVSAGLLTLPVHCCYQVWWIWALSCWCSTEDSWVLGGLELVLTCEPRGVVIKDSQNLSEIQNKILSFPFKNPHHKVVTIYWALCQLLIYWPPVPNSYFHIRCVMGFFSAVVLDGEHNVKFISRGHWRSIAGSGRPKTGHCHGCVLGYPFSFPPIEFPLHLIVA